MLHEATILLAVCDNDGKPLTELHASLGARLCAQYGGCSAYETKGMWIDPDSGKMHNEPIVTFSVAVPKSESLNIRAIAVEFGRKAKQLAVYFRAPTGAVQIINLAQSAAIAA